jgi:hypothetical protein
MIVNTNNTTEQKALHSAVSRAQYDKTPRQIVTNITKKEG